MVNYLGGDGTAWAADTLLADASGHGHNDFKIPPVRRLLKSVLREAVGS